MMLRSTLNLPFLDIINKTGTKIWMDIYSKPTDPKNRFPLQQITCGVV